MTAVECFAAELEAKKEFEKKEFEAKKEEAAVFVLILVEFTAAK